MNRLAKAILGISLLSMGVGVATISPRNSVTNTSVSQPMQVRSQQTIDYYVVQAVIQIESNGNPNAERYEAHINDTSYGLMQLLTGTARELERTFPDLPRLGNTPENIRKSLLNPEINRAYGRRRLETGFNQYNNVTLAVAAYNAGPLTPRNARVQQQLNELLGTSLTLDGNLGAQSKEAISAFQRQYNTQHSQDHLTVDGKLGPQTYRRIQSVWQEQNPGKENPLGIVPHNRYTPNHIRRFNHALDSLVRDANH